MDSLSSVILILMTLIYGVEMEDVDQSQMINNKIGAENLPSDLVPLPAIIGFSCVLNSTESEQEQVFCQYNIDITTVSGYVLGYAQIIWNKETIMGIVSDYAWEDSDHYHNITKTWPAPALGMYSPDVYFFAVEDGIELSLSQRMEDSLIFPFVTTPSDIKVINISSSAHRESEAHLHSVTVYGQCAAAKTDIWKSSVQTRDFILMRPYVNDSAMNVILEFHGNESCDAVSRPMGFFFTNKSDWHRLSMWENNDSSEVIVTVDNETAFALPFVDMSCAVDAWYSLEVEGEVIINCDDLTGVATTTTKHLYMYWGIFWLLKYWCGVWSLA